jgi:hypothetical protein
MHPPFLIEESLRFGWHKTRAHSALLFQAMLVLFAVQVASSIVQKVLANTLQGALAMVALAVLSIVLGAGFTLIALKLAKGEHASLADLVPRARLVWHYFCASVFAGVIIVGGLILLIIPGIYLLLRFLMVRFAVLDGAGITESLKKSSALTHGVKWHLLAFLLVLVLLNILGAALLLVGLLVSVPVTAIAFAHVYLKLKSRG